MRAFLPQFLGGFVLILSSCAPSIDFDRAGQLTLPGEQPLAPGPQKPAQDDLVPPFDPSGTATDNLGAFETALRSVDVADGLLEVELAVSTLISAGFEKSNISHTSPATKTGLQPDSLSIAVLHDGDCLVGQYSDDWLTVAVVPALQTGCLIGEVQDWGTNER